MVNDRHRAFAQAVVALAREHQMDTLFLTMSFREAFRFQDEPADHCSGQMKMTWATGRHGDAAPIRLTWEAQAEVKEKGHPIARTALTSTREG